MSEHPDPQEIDEKLASLELLKQLMRPAEYQRLRAELEESRAAAQTRAGAGSSTAPVSLGLETVLQDRHVDIHTDASGNVIITGDDNTVQLSPDQAPAALLVLYRRALAEDCGNLPLGLLKAEFATPGASGQVGLTNVYTDLDVVSPPRPEQDEQGDFRHFGLRLERGEQGQRAGLLEAISQPRTRYVALVGSPGSGKTTFVNYLAACLAAGQDQGLPEPLRGLLPVRLELRRAALQFPLEARKGEPGMLWSALQEEIARLRGTAAAHKILPYVQRQLESRGGLVLLDGLDEAPEAGRRRKSLLEAIQAWTRTLPKCRFLLTARPYAYADPKWQLPDFELLALAPFNQVQIERFVHRWYQAVRGVMGRSAAESELRAYELLAALQARPDLSDLASRPLLLTLMAALHSHKSRMPEDRAELYEFSVGLLLSRWQTGRMERDVQVDEGIQRTLGLGEERLRSVLEELALQTHVRQRQSAERQEAGALQRSADIPLSEIIALFSQSAPPDFNPRLLLEYLENRAGLLVGRGNDFYTFPHRSFQEYLAACRLANTAPDLAENLTQRLDEDLDWWREVFLLAVGKQRQGGRSAAVDVLNRMLPCEPQEMEQLSDNHWLRSVLAGEAALDLRLSDFAGESEYFKTVLRRLRAWLRQVLEGQRLVPLQRLHAGDVLGRLGDPRPGVSAARFSPSPEHTERQAREAPGIAWVHIPAGQFSMGSPEDEAEAWDDEKPQFCLDLPAFWIGRYPVTNAQYRLFVEQGGYDQERFWMPEGWAWRQGAAPDFSPYEKIDIESLQAIKNWVLGRKERSQPHWWEDPQWGAPTRPVVGITWYEAAAFGRWVGESLRSLSPASDWIPDAARHGFHEGQLAVRLPSEAEWEKAARGPQAWRWAWDDTWQAGQANTEEAGLKQTSPVGMFPPGAHGLYDMTGNVWEWTLSKYGMDVLNPTYRYPYSAQDGRESSSGTEARVVRGGSWGYYRRIARCASRNWFIPAAFLGTLGFRMVLSLADPGF